MKKTTTTEQQPIQPRLCKEDHVNRILIGVADEAGDPLYTCGACLFSKLPRLLRKYDTKAFCENLNVDSNEAWQELVRVVTRLARSEMMLRFSLHDAAQKQGLRLATMCNEDGHIVYATREEANAAKREANRKEVESAIRRAHHNKAFGSAEQKVLKHSEALHNGN